LQLVELGEGTEDTGCRVTIEELILCPENALPVDALLKVLKDAHLITADEAAVQVADEALIREWKRLREWLDQDRDDLRVHRHLAHAAQEWEMMQRDPSALYRGARLAQALEWARTNADEISAARENFLMHRNTVGRRAGGDCRDCGSVYEKLSPEEQTRTRRILLQLTELGEGTRDTPRSSTLEELVLRPRTRCLWKRC